MRGDEPLPRKSFRLSLYGLFGISTSPPRGGLRWRDYRLESRAASATTKRGELCLLHTSVIAEASAITARPARKSLVLLNGIAFDFSFRVAPECETMRGDQPIITRGLQQRVW